MAQKRKKKHPPKKTRRRPPPKPPKKIRRPAPRKRPPKKPAPRKRAAKKRKVAPRRPPPKPPKKVRRPAPPRRVVKRPRRPPAPPRPQRWYTDTGREQAEAKALERLPTATDEAREALRDDLQAIARADEKLYLRESVKKLRRMFDGFGAEHYDLRHPELWTRAQVTKVKEFYGTVAQVFSQPHVTLVTPRSRRSRIALESFTGQRYKNQRAFAVALPSADSTVSVRDGVVEILRKVHRGKLVDQFFLFEEVFGIRPEGWRDIIEMTQIMVGTTLKERMAKYRKSYLFDADQEVTLRDMPEGFYTIWSEVNGDIGIPVRKQFLARQMREWFEAYGQEASATYHEGFDEVILGFHYQSTIRTDKDALRRKAELDSDRRTKQAERRKEWRARRRRVRR